MEGIFQFHNKPITKGKQAIYALECLLDSNFEQIPLLVGDHIEGKIYLNQLMKGEMFVWNISDVKFSSGLPELNEGESQDLQSIESDTLIESTPKKVIRDIIYHEVESDNECDVTYKLRHNSTNDCIKIPLNWNNNRKTSLHNYFFCDIKGEKICQFYEVGKDGKAIVCNTSVVRSKNDPQGRSLARQLKRHLRTEHDFFVEKNVLDIEILQHFCPSRDDYMLLERYLKRISPTALPNKQLTQKLVLNTSGYLNTYQKKANRKFSDWDAFCMFVRITVHNYGSYASVEDEDWKVFHDYIGSNANPECWRRRKAPSAIAQSANMVMQKVKLFFSETCSMVDKFSVASCGLNNVRLNHAITVQYEKKIGKLNPWVSLEADGWKSNKGDDCVCITLNFLDSNLEKKSLPIFFQKVESKSKKALSELFTETSREIGMTNSITTCCTDNASNVMNSSDHFLSDADYPSFNSHEGCLVHQLQLFVEALIEDIGSVLNTIDDISPNVQNFGRYKVVDDDTLLEQEPEQDSWSFYFQSSTSPDIVKRLFKLSRKLRANTNLKDKFLPIVGSLPCSESPTRWNSTFYALKHYLEHIDGYKQFAQLFDDINADESFNIPCTEGDIITAKIFYEILTPFEAMTKLLSQNTPLSICKLPLMFYIKEIVSIAKKQLMVALNKEISFEKFEGKFNKYLKKNLQGRYITYLASLFFIEEEHVLDNAKENDLEWLQLLTDLAYQLLNCEFKPGRSLRNKQSHGTSYVKIVCRTNSFQLENECMNRFETIGTIKTF